MQIGILGPLTASDDSGQSLAVSGVLVRWTRGAALNQDELLAAI